MQATSLRARAVGNVKKILLHIPGENFVNR